MRNEASIFPVGTIDRDSPRTSPDQRSGRRLPYDAEFTLPSSHKCPISKTLITSFCAKNQYSPRENASASERPPLEIYKTNLSSDTKLILTKSRKDNLSPKSSGRRRENPQTVPFQRGRA